MSNLGDISITSNVKFPWFLSIFPSKRSEYSGSANSTVDPYIGVQLLTSILTAVSLRLDIFSWLTLKNSSFSTSSSASSVAVSSSRQRYILLTNIVSGTSSVADPGMFLIPGSEFVHPGSRIRGQKESGSRIRIRIKEFKYFWPKNCFKALGFRIQDLWFFTHQGSRNPGLKKATDSGGSGSATLVDGYSFFAEAGSSYKFEGFGPQYVICFF